MAQILMLRKAHFFSLDNDLIDVHAKVIGSTALSVYVALARFVNRKTGECWPSIGRLASLLDLARNTVKAALRTLEAAGLIAIRRRRDPAGDATSHLYTLLDASPAAVQIRLAQRHRAAVEAPETGRAPDDPPRQQGVGQEMIPPRLPPAPQVGHRLTRNHCHPNQSKRTSRMLALMALEKTPRRRRRKPPARIPWTNAGSLAN
jgi:DNA-binding MarR family transcriptional regulator